ncbi:hypothetical protein CC78DRAFT_536926 [Lojkania enalia]|uniref:Uncharacterized protein n=1 Tax=Lojkania enalia TaxID=147567 RepID=A0A9P4K1K2_9PLEO|nr:hypothetical protein CC78DRAFT_536926 [Didymosphaeria enalia]
MIRRSLITPIIVRPMLLGVAFATIGLLLRRSSLRFSVTSSSTPARPNRLDHYADLLS